MTELTTYNAARIEVKRDGPRAAPIAVTMRRLGTENGACRAFLTVDDASVLAAVLANAVDAVKRG